MSEKHTPGPWTYEPHGDTVALYAGRDSDRHGLRLMNLDDGDSNFEANARLIAAAPQLLAACRAVVEAWGGSHAQMQHAASLAAAAIASACPDDTAEHEVLPPTHEIGEAGA